MTTICLTKLTSPDFATLVPQAEFLKCLGEPSTLCDADRAAYLTECLGPVAIEVLEDWLGLTYFTASYEWTFTELFGKRFVLPNGPLQSITSFEYRDENDAWQPVDPTVYTMECPGLRLVTGKCWPHSCVCEYRIVYVAGYADWSSLPKRFQYVLTAIVRHWDANRDAFIDGNCKSVPLTLKTIVNQLKERRRYGPQVHCRRAYEIANYVSA